MQDHSPAIASAGEPSDDESKQENRDGLWVAFELDERGGARALDWSGIERLNDGHGPLWIHIDPSVARALEWLHDESGLSEAEVADLLRDDLRPRLEPASGEALVLSLRGLAPELERSSRDLTLLHLRADPRRLISVCDRALPGVVIARERFERGEGPTDLAALIVSMASWLGAALQRNAFALEDPLVELEYEAELGHTDTATRVRELQGRVTRLRRHLAPFKVILRRALELERCWFTRDHVTAWRNLGDQAQDTDVLLQSLHERLTSVHDYVGERLARSMNYVLYVLTIFSTILLPLTFVTGLFGMNVGIRGASYRFMESTLAFLAVTAGLAALGWLGYRFVKKRRILPTRTKDLSEF